MVRDGLYYAGALVLAGALVWRLAGAWFAVPAFLLALFCLYFFRDPERTPPPGAVVLSPTDGKVVAVRPDSPGHTRISVFLNVFDVHVARAPIGGAVASLEYRPGRFLVASREEASIQNEQSIIALDGGGSRVVFKLIAGLIARRIVCYKRPGDRVAAGERFGLIKFGSRADVLLGPEWTVTVREGQRVRAGETILARGEGGQAHG